MIFFLKLIKPEALIGVLFLLLWGCERNSARVTQKNEKVKPKVAQEIKPKGKITPAKKQNTKIDTNTQHLLLVGDSMAGGAGLEYGFRRYAAYNGHRLTVVSEASTTTSLWSKKQKLKSVIKKYKPTFVIIALGSNELFVQDISQRKTAIENIIKQLGDLPMVWVGPPNWQKDTGINDVIRSIVGEKRFFLSENIKIARQHDGIHPSIAGSLTWVNEVSYWIMYESACKIRLADPLEPKQKTKTIETTLQK